MIRAGFLGGFFAAAMASRVQMFKFAGPYRIELDLLPAEPFVSAAAAASGAVTEGMVRVGGAAPVSPAHTNHHLVAHVYDRRTGRAMTHAAVSISYARSGSGMPPVLVPIVRMQAAGEGPQSTHYGNNVRMRPGAYDITVTADRRPALFHLTISPPMGNGATMK